MPLNFVYFVSFVVNHLNLSSRFNVNRNPSASDSDGR